MSALVLSRFAALLQELDIEGECTRLREDMREATSEAKRKKIAKRLKVLDAFNESEVNSPEFMVLEDRAGYSARSSPAWFRSTVAASRPRT